MPRKPTTLSVLPMTNEEEDDFVTIATPDSRDPVANTSKNEVSELNRMLAAVLDYLSDDEVEVIDIEVILDKTPGLRDWWESYRESNKKDIEEEIAKSLAELSLKDLERIREQIKGIQTQE